MAFAIGSFVLTTPYFFFWNETKIMLMHITAFLFNSGVNIFVLLFFATYNTKRIDLSKSSAMNYQGSLSKTFSANPIVGAHHFVLVDFDILD